MLERTAKLISAIFAKLGRRLPALSEAQDEDAAPIMHFSLFDGIMDEFISTALVDSEYGVVLTPTDDGTRRVQDEARASGDVVKAGVQAMEYLELDDEIEEIRISLGQRVHFMRPLDRAGSMYLYVALKKEKARYFDTARARVKMAEIAFGI